MRGPVRYGLLVIATAVVVGGGLYWFGSVPALAAVAGVGWGAGVAATAHLARRYPNFRTGNTWTDVRWTQLGALVTILSYAGLLGTGLSFASRIALVVLVGGIGFTAHVTGMVSVLEQVEVGGKSPSTPGVSGDD